MVLLFVHLGILLQRLTFVGVLPHQILTEHHGFTWSVRLLSFQEPAAEERKFLEGNAMLLEQDRVCVDREFALGSIPKNAAESVSADAVILPEAGKHEVHDFFQYPGVRPQLLLNCNKDATLPSPRRVTLCML